MKLKAHDQSDMQLICDPEAGNGNRQCALYVLKNCAEGDAASLADQALSGVKPTQCFDDLTHLHQAFKERMSETGVRRRQLLFVTVAVWGQSLQRGTHQQLLFVTVVCLSGLFRDRGL